MEPDSLAQLQQALTSAACLAATIGIGLMCTWLKSHFNMTAADSAETAIRKAANTEAGIIASSIPATATAAATAPAALVNTGVLAQAANKVILDLPNEVKLTAYTPKDIEDMILGALPMILGAVNPALGAAAGAAAGVIKAASAA